MLFAEQDNIAKEKRRKHLEKSEYAFRAQANKDSIRDKDNKHARPK
jgi:hypothetical protein